MYPVSEAFLSAVQENTRRYYWTGKITTVDEVVYTFGEKDIVKGSGYISASVVVPMKWSWEQCTRQKWESRSSLM